MRGEGNHKIPGSFAPENMEKTGAERVKYSLACQYEDAIPIKLVSYVQKCPTVLCTFAVALRKESVDRNPEPTLLNHLLNLSLSARRAWIEMLLLSALYLRLCVALRKESVDRNNLLNFLQGLVCRSLSARRAWIEIFDTLLGTCRSSVALRKESVDRNPPSRQCAEIAKRSLSARRAWIEISAAKYR